MTPAQLAERKAAYGLQVQRAIDDLTAVHAALPAGDPNRRLLVNAATELRECFQRLTVVTDGLAVYTDPDFYLELPPSRALEDQGQHARDKLEQAFPE